MQAVQVKEVKVQPQKIPSDVSVGNKYSLFKPAELNEGHPQHSNKNVVKEGPQIWTNWSLALTVWYLHDSFVSLLERNRSDAFWMDGWNEAINEREMEIDSKLCSREAH